MDLYEAAGLIAADLRRCGYVPSDGKTIQFWDRIFFGQPAPDETRERPCQCGGVLTCHQSDYICGQWQCNTCTRVFRATIAETIGALRKEVEDLKETVGDYRR